VLTGSISLLYVTTNKKLNKKFSYRW